MIDEFRKIRRELDAFKPDFVLIWGDDQYENFREDCVPAVLRSSPTTPSTFSRGKAIAAGATCGTSRTIRRSR